MAERLAAVFLGLSRRRRSLKGVRELCEGGVGGAYSALSNWSAIFKGGW